MWHTRKNTFILHLVKGNIGILEQLNTPSGIILKDTDIRRFRNHGRRKGRDGWAVPTSE